MHPFLDHPHPIVFAHRGCHESGPENTFEAFQGAVAAGVSYLETDVHLSLDGELVAFHDASLLRLTGCDQRIDAMNFRDIAAIRLDHDARIPRLVDLLDAFPNAKFNIDLKSDETVAPFIKLATTSPIAERICIGSFSDQRTAAAKAAVPGLCTSLGPKGMRRALAAIYLGLPLELPADCAQIPPRVGPIRLATKSLIKGLARRGLQTHYWTINDIEGMGRLIDLGADGIMTDRPRQLIECLKARNLWVA